MSGKSHWKAEDYAWDPHNLQSTKRSTRGSKKTDEAGIEERQQPIKIEEGLEQDNVPEGADTSPTIGSGDDTSHMHTSGGDASRGAPSATTISGTGTADDLAEAPTSARRNVPVLKDAYQHPKGGHKKRIPMFCQVDGCQKDLSKEKEYYQRYRICEHHLKLSSLIKDGVPQRFCQQCGRFHILADFDSDKRSCRARLNLHNNRRRKRIPNAQETPRQELSAVELRSRRTRTRRKGRGQSEPEAEPMGEEQPGQAERPSESLPSRLSRGQHEQAERPLPHRENTRLSDVESLRFPQRETFRTPNLLDNTQMQFYPEGTSTVQGFAQGIGGIFEPEPRRSFESLGDPHSGNSRLGSLPHQSIQSNVESGSPMSMHLATQLGAESAQSRAGLRQGTYASGRHYLLESADSISGAPPPLPLRTVPAQDYAYQTPALVSGWSQGAPSSIHDQHGLHHPSAAYMASQGHSSLAAASPQIPQHVPGFSLRYSMGLSPSASSPIGMRRNEPSASSLAGQANRQWPLAASAPDQMPIPEHPFAPFTTYPRAENRTSPTHLRHSDPGSLRPLFSEFEEATPSAYQPSRWSDPGGWTHHYPGMIRDSHLSSSLGTSASLGAERHSRLMRSALKMDFVPDLIPEDMRDTFLSINNAPGGGHVEAAMRPGCTQLIATCLVQDKQPSALDGLACLMSSDSNFWSQTRVLAQHADSAAEMEAGRVNGFWAGPLHRSLQPLKPQTGARAVSSGGHLTVRHTRESGGVAPIRLLARCNGIFLHDTQVDGEEGKIEVPQVDCEGVLWLETENRGFLSEPTAVVLCQDPDIIEDIRSIDDSVLLSQMPSEEIDSILVDIGMVLQYSAYLHADKENHSGQGNGKMGASCCHISLPAAADQADQGRMTGGTYLHYICRAARRLLALCCREGWPHLAYRVLPVAAIGLVCWAELVQDIEILLGHNMLLHAVLASSSKAMLILILDLFNTFREPVNLSGKVKGMTALHLAAAMPDGGAMADAVLQRCPQAKSMWNSVRNLQGQSPADVAYMAYQRLTAAGREREEMINRLCQQTETLNSPPPTPRLTEPPNSGYKRIVDATSLLPLNSTGINLKELSRGQSKADNYEEGNQRASPRSHPVVLDVEDPAMEQFQEILPDGVAHVSSPQRRRSERQKTDFIPGDKATLTEIEPAGANDNNCQST